MNLEEALQWAESGVTAQAMEDARRTLRSWIVEPSYPMRCDINAPHLQNGVAIALREAMALADAMQIIESVCFRCGRQATSRFQGNCDLSFCDCGQCGLPACEEHKL